jgi:DNA-directed RNA polymerase subunit RPC12/RpoP
MEQRAHTVGERVEKHCATCNAVQGHVVASVTKLGHISRVDCPHCGTRSAYKQSDGATVRRPSTSTGAPYDPTRTYRTGQAMTHPVFGAGEVTAVFETLKIDVLFSDRLRRLIHARR